MKTDGQKPVELVHVVNGVTQAQRIQINRVVNDIFDTAMGQKCGTIAYNSKTISVVSDDMENWIGTYQEES